MAAPGPATIQDEMTATGSMQPVELEDTLLSYEKLDRASPDLWPEQIPGLDQWNRTQPVLSMNNRTRHPVWNEPLLSADDLHMLQQLSCLSTSSIIMEVKQLHDHAYKLGVEEAREMTRGKYLDIFKSKNR